jgi:hypothetical protein
MQFFKKTVLLASFYDISKLLEHNIIKTNYISNNIAVRHYMHQDLNVIRIWNVNSISKYLYEESAINNFIIAFDYKIEQDRIKIEYLNMNDNKYSNTKYNSNYLTDNDVYELTSSIVIFIEKIARENNKNRIVIDVHKDLKTYNKYYKDFFQVTSRISLDHPRWIEIEKNIYL